MLRCGSTGEADMLGITWNKNLFGGCDLELYELPVFASVYGTGLTAVRAGRQEKEAILAVKEKISSYDL